MLITVFAAVITTAVWYFSAKARGGMLGRLCLIYWGAAIMWTADAVAEYIELKSEFFTPAPADMLNDAFLGLSAVALGLMIWLVTVLVKDPKSVIRSALIKK